MRLRRFNHLKQLDGTATPAGAGWLVAALYLNAVVVLRNVLYVSGIFENVRLVSQVGAVLVLACLIASLLSKPDSPRPPFAAASQVSKKLVAWFSLLALQASAGLLRSNNLLQIGRELFVLSAFGLLCLLLQRPGMWTAIRGHLLVIVSFAAALIPLFWDTPNPIVTQSDTHYDPNALLSSRRVNTVGFMINEIMSVAPILALTALFERPTFKTSIAVFYGLLAYTYTILIFQFRSAAVVLLLLLVTIGLYALRAGRRVSPVALFAGLCMAIAIALYVVSGQDLLQLSDRVKGLDRTDATETLLSSRLLEAQALLESLHPVEYVIGKGLGGTYDAYAVIGLEWATRWPTVHFGVLVFLLKGGLMFVAVYLWLAIGTIRAWLKRANDIPVAAAYVPVLLFTSFLNPFPLTMDNLFTWLPLAVCIATCSRSADECKLYLRTGGR